MPCSVTVRLQNNNRNIKYLKENQLKKMGKQKTFDAGDWGRSIE